MYGKYKRRQASLMLGHTGDLFLYNGKTRNSLVSSFRGTLRLDRLKLNDYSSYRWRCSIRLEDRVLVPKEFL